MTESAREVLRTPGGRELMRMLEDLEKRATDALLNYTAGQDITTDRVKYHRGLRDGVGLVIQTLEELKDGGEKETSVR